MFAVLLGLALLFLVFNFITVNLDKMCCRFISLIIWNLITIITIPLFLLSCAFGMLGTAFIYLPAFLDVFLSTQGLTVYLNAQSANILNQCINGDGNMKSVLLGNGTTDYSSIFNNFYNIAYQLNNITNQISNSTNSQICTQQKSTYVKMETNIALAIGTDSNSPASVISDLNSNTQKSYPNSKISSCSSQTEDIWVSDNVSCPTSSTIVVSSDPTSNLGNPSCLNILQWTSSQATTRYTDRNKCNGSDNSALVSNYISNLNTYATNAKPEVQQLEASMDT